MKIFHILCVILVLSCFVLGQKQIRNQPKVPATPKPIATVLDIVTTKDGRRIELRSDKTWEYAAEEVGVKKEMPPPVEIIETDYSKKPLILSTVKLPKGFMGHDFDLLYDVLSGKKSYKSEFETTEDYLKKVSNLQALDKNSQFAVFSKKSFTTYDLKYDADLKVFTIGLKFEDRALFPFTTYVPILDIDMFASSQGMLTKGIIVTNSTSLINPIKISMEAEKAKNTKENAELLILFSLKEPLFVNKENKNFSYVIGNRAVLRELAIAEVNELWLVNKLTGEIYEKVKVP